MILMLVSTADAARFGNVILKTDSSTGFVDFLKFPACGYEDKFNENWDHAWDHTYNDKDKPNDKDKSKDKGKYQALNLTKMANRATIDDYLVSNRAGQYYKSDDADIQYSDNITNVGKTDLYSNRSY